MWKNPALRSDYDAELAKLPRIGVERMKYCTGHMHDTALHSLSCSRTLRYRVVTNRIVNCRLGSIPLTGLPEKRDLTLANAGFVDELAVVGAADAECYFATGLYIKTSYVSSNCRTRTISE